MKPVTTFISQLLITAVILTSTNAAQAQTTQAEVIAYMKEHGWTATSENYIAYLSEGGGTTWRCRYFYADTEYAIVAFSQDADVTDMDVDMEYCNGDYFDSDGDVDDWGIVVFTGTGSRLDYKMTNASSDDPHNSSKCQYILFCR